jgi:glycosyltransferase involved in cell wall biosynthesis
MHILWRGFLGRSHSWAICGQNICRELIKLGHQVDMFSTNGLQYFPDDLRPNLIGWAEEGSRQLNGRLPTNNYDFAISYTQPGNWQAYLSHGKIKFGIWTTEVSGIGSLPPHFVSAYQATTKILAPSSFSRNVYLENSVPSDRVEVVPHGYSDEFISRSDTYPLKSNRRCKFLITLGQIHRRKNIKGILEAYGRAFSNIDDVVLVAKLNLREPKFPFEENWDVLYSEFKRKFPKAAPIEVIGGFVPFVSDLHRATDAYICLSNGEGFNIPALNSLVSNKLLIVPEYGGHRDFCDATNSLLVRGEMVKAPMQYQYWQPSPKAMMFQPDVEHAAELMRSVYQNTIPLQSKLLANTEDIRNHYSWKSVAEQITKLAELELCRI